MTLVNVIKNASGIAALTAQNKDDILTDLQILNDEPISTNLLFNFETFGNQLNKLLRDKTIPTPFAMGLDGE